MSPSTAEQTDILTPCSIYLAGPMRGYENFNFETFAAAAFCLRLEGFDVWSPAEHDLANGFDPSSGECAALREYMKVDLPAVLSADAIVLLPGWEASEGANLEYDVATACDIPAYSYPTLERIDTLPGSPEPVNVVDGQRIVTNAVTGGQKETRPARFDLLPWDQLWKVAELYAYGATKYADRNWEQGYDFSLSIAALYRHMAKFTQGESMDGESGQHHLASVVFHALALMRFEQEIAGRHMPRELDNRPEVGFAYSAPPEPDEQLMFAVTQLPGDNWWEEAA